MRLLIFSDTQYVCDLKTDFSTVPSVILMLIRVAPLMSGDAYTAVARSFSQQTLSKPNRQFQKAIYS